MLKPFIQRPERGSARHERERGVTMALVALAMVGIIAMAGLSVDIGTLYQASAEAQRAADAGALAAAQIISISGLTGDPANVSGSWQLVCGGVGSPASSAAITAVQQNLVGRTAIATASISVTYSAGSAAPGGIGDCSATTAAFGINPVVTVTVTQPNLPTFFARIWGKTATSVSASASAEAFNPSGSENYSNGGTVVPVQPRCVKPWIVPNVDPLHPTAGCINSATSQNCQPLISETDGSIQNPGVYNSNSGIIGETFHLIPDCNATGNCNSGGGATTFVNPPTANYGTNSPPTLQYVPGVVPAGVAATPSCASSADAYQQAIAGCDETTVYQCGVQASSLPNPNMVDLTENPGHATSDTSQATQCLIHQLSGQDNILDSSFPFAIIAGAGNPLRIAGTQITSSNSIMSLPIYDNAPGGTLTPLTPNGNNQAPVTIIGFLEVFVTSIDATVDGGLDVTVLNVAGCGNQVTAGTAALAGTSPVPVRLITPP